MTVPKQSRSQGAVKTAVPSKRGRRPFVLDDVMRETVFDSGELLFEIRSQAFALQDDEDAR